MPSNYEVKAVIFDLGRVLIKVDMTRGLFRRVRERYPQNDVALMEKLFRDDLFTDFASGKLPPNQFHLKLCQKFNLYLDYDQFVTEWCDVFEPMAEMDSLFYDVRQKYRVGLLSDVDPLHWSFVQNYLYFIDKIEKPTLSFRTGILKPALQAYRIAALNVDQPIKHCLFIDDRIINVEGAKKAGMQAVQFLNVKQLYEHLKSRNLI